MFQEEPFELFWPDIYQRFSAANMHWMWLSVFRLHEYLRSQSERSSEFGRQSSAQLAQEFLQQYSSTVESELYLSNTTVFQGRLGQARQEFASKYACMQESGTEYWSAQEELFDIVES